MTSCEIIRDLLPLYVDGVCSDKTKQYVEEHVAECEECKKLSEEFKGKFAFLRVPKEEESKTPYIGEIHPLKKIKERNQRRTTLLMAAIFLLLVGVGIMFYGNLKNWYQEVIFEVASEDMGEILTAVEECMQKKWKVSEDLYVVKKMESGMIFGSAREFSFWIFDAKKENYYVIYCKYSEEMGKATITIERDKETSNYSFTEKELLSLDKFLGCMLLMSDELPEVLKNYTLILRGMGKRSSSGENKIYYLYEDGTLKETEDLPRDCYRLEFNDLGGALRITSTEDGNVVTIDSKEEETNICIIYIP